MTLLIPWILKHRLDNHEPEVKKVVYPEKSHFSLSSGADQQGLLLCNL